MGARAQSEEDRHDRQGGRSPRTLIRTAAAAPGTHPSTPVRAGPPCRREYECRRHGTASLVASFDVQTRKVTDEDFERNDSVTFIAFLEAIERSLDEGLAIHVVLDNGSSHTSKATKAWLAGHPRFVRPPHPDARKLAQPVECFVSILTRKVLRRGELSSRDDLVQKMLAFVEHHSETAKPFKWVYGAKLAA